MDFARGWPFHLAVNLCMTQEKHTQPCYMLAENHKSMNQYCTGNVTTIETLLSKQRLKHGDTIMGVLNVNYDFIYVYNVETT